jgi:hypothetical protein
LRALGTKNDARYNLKIIDTGRPAGSSDDSSSRRSSSAGDDTDEPVNGDDDIVTSVDEEVEEDHTSVISKTRKELEELDDLDV